MTLWTAFLYAKHRKRTPVKEGTIKLHFANAARRPEVRADIKHSVIVLFSEETEFSYSTFSWNSANGKVKKPFFASWDCTSTHPIALEAREAYGRTLRAIATCSWHKRGPTPTHQQWIRGNTNGTGNRLAQNSHPTVPTFSLQVKWWQLMFFLRWQRAEWLFDAICEDGLQGMPTNWLPGQFHGFGESWHLLSGRHQTAVLMTWQAAGQRMRKSGIETRGTLSWDPNFLCRLYSP